MVTLAQLPSAQQSISSSSAECSITSFHARSLLIAVAKLILPGNIKVEFKLNQTAFKYTIPEHSWMAVNVVGLSIWKMGMTYRTSPSTMNPKLNVVRIVIMFFVIPAMKNRIINSSLT